MAGLQLSIKSGIRRPSSGSGMVETTAHHRPFMRLVNEGIGIPLKAADETGTPSPLGRVFDVRVGSEARAGVHAKLIGASQVLLKVIVLALCRRHVGRC